MAIDSARADVTVSRLAMSDVEGLADELHSELRAWTASSTQALSDYHFEDLAMMVDNATFNDRIEFRIATLDGRRAGIAVTRAGEHRGEPSTFVWWLAVDPAARRSGVARALVDAIEQDARERSRFLEGMVRADDAAAVAFWSALGWSPAGPDPRASWIRGLRAPDLQDAASGSASGSAAVDAPGSASAAQQW
jgi:ribosomal protein S18 acetylase RimI-like enzyme